MKINRVCYILAIVGIIALGSSLYILDKARRLNEGYRKEYVQNIKALNDTIQELKADIKVYQAEIDNLGIEREKIRQELKVILEGNEKAITDITNGSLDDNIKFLTDFLSENDSGGK